MARPLAPRGTARARVLTAALDLFAEFGVSGTSLQMIADHLGVTKAAVYYQFKAKEEIVLAVLAPAFETLHEITGDDDVEPWSPSAAGAAMAGLVDLMIEERQLYATLFRDPDAVRIVHAHPEFQLLTERLGQLLLGPQPSTRRRISVSLLGGGLAQVGMDPMLVDIEDDDLRTEITRIGRALLALT
ncbi:MAG: helix-turn-helix domain-containing protein [Terracoccus sp.]